MDACRESANRKPCGEICKVSTAGESMKKTVLYTIWKTAESILPTAAGITAINNSHFFTNPDMTLDIFESHGYNSCIFKNRR